MEKEIKKMISALEKSGIEYFVEDGLLLAYGDDIYEDYEMPFDKDGCHATGREIYSNCGGNWCWQPEYETEEDYE